MAVQAAIMNPHFIHFCFPGSAVEYEMGSAYGGVHGAPGLGLGLGGEEEEEAAAMAGSPGEGRQTTSALLSFIDSASSNIKLALDKPGKSKRKVNHRKYLQKQIKRCNGMMAGGCNAAAAQNSAAEAVSKRQSPSPSSSSSSSSSSSHSTAGHFQCKPPPKKDGSQSQSNLQSKSLAALFGSVQDLRREAGGGGGGGGRKVPLRNPPSPGPSPGLTLRDLERGHPELFELLGPDYSSLAPGQEAAFLPSAPRLHREPSPDHQPHYEAYHRGGGGGGFSSSSHFPDPWLPCNPGKKSPPPAPRCPLGLSEHGIRTGPVQAACYPHSEAAGSSSAEDSGVGLTAFPQFFPECSLPQVSYEYNSPGYTCSRQHFPSL
eukprot:gi/632937983/ref/XP_007901785.1/ PREDICTED: protein FAM181B [Callorhinchus milii]